MVAHQLYLQTLFLGSALPIHTKSTSKLANLVLAIFERNVVRKVALNNCIHRFGYKSKQPNYAPHYKKCREGGQPYR